MNKFTVNHLHDALIIEYPGFGNWFYVFDSPGTAFEMYICISRLHVWWEDKAFTKGNVHKHQEIIEEIICMHGHAVTII